MEYTAKQIAGFINGTVEGNDDVKVNAISRIEEGKTGTLSFLGNPKYEEYIYGTEADDRVGEQGFFPAKPIGSTLIRVDNAYEAFTRLLKALDNRQKKTGREEPCFVHPSAKIGEGVYVGAFAYVGENVVPEDGVPDLSAYLCRPRHHRGQEFHVVLGG